MTPTELRIFRARLDITQSRLGEMLGVTVQTIFNYENSKTEIPLAIELAIKHLEKAHGNTEIGADKAID